jgi:BolA family transcriptional regulator, general stress-responsive regulator
VSTAEQLRARLERALRPTRVEIMDESERHRGHGGWREGGESHFRVVVVSERFHGLSRVDRQRLVHEAAAELLRERIHALSIRALTPTEAEAAP